MFLNIKPLPISIDTEGTPSFQRLSKLLQLTKTSVTNSPFQIGIETIQYGCFLCGLAIRLLLYIVHSYIFQREAT